MAGIAVDFYGFAEIKHLEERSGSKRFKIIFPGGENDQYARDDSKRFKFIFPQGGGAPSPDPIAVFRGAKRPDLAKIFIEYILSLDGQKLLDFKINTPGGPVRTTMRRTPILKTIYNEEFSKYRVDPTINPYKSAATFISHDEWTEPVFVISGTLIKLAFIDNNIELVDAWEAILRARKEGRAEEAKIAEELMTDLSALDYIKVIEKLIPTFQNKDIASMLHVQNELSNYFRQRYILAKSIANGTACLSEK